MFENNTQLRGAAWDNVLARMRARQMAECLDLEILFMQEVEIDDAVLASLGELDEE